MKKILGLNSGYCWVCKQDRIMSLSEPHFCLSCGYYYDETKEKLVVEG